MARKKSATLTEAELRVMEIIWNRGPSTVQEVVDDLPAETPLAYSTVLTMLRILEKKGYLEHQKSGRAFVYQAIVEKEQAQQGALKDLIKRFFNNSPEQLVLNLMKDDSLEQDDIDRIQSLINDAAKEDNDGVDNND